MKRKLGTSYQRNGIRFWIGRWTNVITGLEYRRPVLAVKVDGDNTIYKLASFDSEEKAGWFVDLFGEYAAERSVKVCPLHSDDEVTEYCVEGPCTDEMEGRCPMAERSEE